MDFDKQEGAGTTNSKVYLLEIGAKPTESDNCLFKLGEGEDMILIAVYWWYQKAKEKSKNLETS